MGTVTYLDPKVSEYIEKYFIPVQFNVAEQPEAMTQFNASWTPTLIVLDADGREHRRSQGYLNAKRFLAEMALARVKDAIDRQEFAAAEERAKLILAENELVKAAQERAAAIIREAEERAEEIRRGADSYVLEVLTGLETELMRLLATVRKGKATVERAVQGEFSREGRDERAADR